MALKLSAIWALLVGLTLAVLEIRANWGDWQFWPFWLVDFVASAMLIAGGLAWLLKRPIARPMLAAGWGFTLGMAWMSLGSNLEAGPDPARDARLGGAYLVLVGMLVASALAGLVLSLMRAPRRHRFKSARR